MSISIDIGKMMDIRHIRNLEQYSSAIWLLVIKHLFSYEIIYKRLNLKFISVEYKTFKLGNSFCVNLNIVIQIATIL